jgi:hypothetical protein
MGCHTLHIIVRALDLGLPISVSTSAAFLMEPTDTDPEQPWMRARKARHTETFPAASIVTWQFAAGAPGVTWYDGGLKPPRPKLPASGILFIGDKGELFSGFSGGPRLLTESRRREWNPPSKTLPRMTNETTQPGSPARIGHYQEWVAACKGAPDPTCNWNFGALLTEITLLGAIAQRTGAHLDWDASAMRFTNNPEANRYVA